MSVNKSEYSTRMNTLNTTYLGSIKNAVLGHSDYINATFTGAGDAKNVFTQFINKIYTQGTNSTFSALSTATPGADFGTSSLAVNSYKTVRTAFDLPIDAFNIYLFDRAPQSGNAGYTAYPIASFTKPSLTTITDMNCMDLLFTVRSSSTTVPNAFYFAQGLYAFYSLFDSNNWKLFKSGQPVTFSVPDINASGKNITFTSVTLNPPATVGGAWSSIITGATGSPVTQLDILYTIMNALINFSDLQAIANFNPFVARRLIHLHIVSMNYAIVLDYGSQDSVNVNTATTSTLVDLLKNANDNITSTSTNNSLFKNIVNAVGVRAQKYQKNQTNITQLDQDMSALKTQLGVDSNKLTAREQYQVKMKKYMIASLVIFFFILVSSAILIVSPLEYKNKLNSSVGLIIIAVITAFIIQYQYNKNVVLENFSQNRKTNGKLYENFTIATPDHTDAFNEQIVTYLNNTFMLANTLDAYHLYGNINYAMDRENMFFDESKTRLSNKNALIKDVYNISYIKQVQNTAYMNLAINLSVILSIAVTLYVALENFQTLRTYVIGISVIISLLLLVVYMLDATSRVRASPKQIYWNDADISALK
jgi:hypothetical protein